MKAIVALRFGCGEIAAAALQHAYREPALALGQRSARGVEDRDFIAGDGGAGAAGADGGAACGNEDVHHFGRADAVDDPHAGPLGPGAPRRRPS